MTVKRILATMACTQSPDYSCQECKWAYNALRKQEVRNCPDESQRKHSNTPK